MLVHLLDIHCKQSHTTVNGMESNMEENFYHEWYLDCWTVLCALAWRCLKAIRFVSVGCHLEFLTASFQVKIVSPSATEQEPEVALWVIGE
jgi:hypothetical protein